MTYECKCCSSTLPPEHLDAREMMYGTREPFLYFSCVACGSLQIAEVPSDLPRHYRHSIYASWRELPAHIKVRPDALQRFLRRQRTLHAMGKFSPLGALLTKLYGPPDFPFDWSWFKTTDVRTNSLIFDFGCGTGDLLHYLRVNGFERLVGYDKFAGKQVSDPDLSITSEPPLTLKGQCHLVMSHHVLEHMPDPLSAIRELWSYAREGGHLLIRLPIAASAVAKEYGRDWVQLDAPRHLVIPSERGMRTLVQRAGLFVANAWYDSSAYQFVGSERYRADMPMFSESPSSMEGQTLLFSMQARTAFAARAEELNRIGQGDQATFILRSAG